MGDIGAAGAHGPKHMYRPTRGRDRLPIRLERHDPPTAMDHPDHLPHDRYRIVNVLQHALDPDGIKAPTLERQFPRVRHLECNRQPERRYPGPRLGHKLGADVHCGDVPARADEPRHLLGVLPRAEPDLEHPRARLKAQLLGRALLHWPDEPADQLEVSYRRCRVAVDVAPVLAAAVLRADSGHGHLLARPSGCHFPTALGTTAAVPHVHM